MTIFPSSLFMKRQTGGRFNGEQKMLLWNLNISFSAEYVTSLSISVMH